LAQEGAHLQFHHYRRAHRFFVFENYCRVVMYLCLFIQLPFQIAFEFFDTL